MFITLYQLGGVHFHWLGTNGFHVKAKIERFTAASWRCRQNLKYENFTSLFGRLRQSIAPKSVPHVLHDYFSSFNQSNHWFVALYLMLPSSNLKLPSILLRIRVGGPFVMSITKNHESHYVGVLDNPSILRMRVTMSTGNHTCPKLWSSFNSSLSFHPRRELPGVFVAKLSEHWLLQLPNLLMAFPRERWNSTKTTDFAQVSRVSPSQGRRWRRG